MAKSVIAYDKDLPEIPGRCPWERPTSYLVKDTAAPGGWRIDDSGRRPSTLLLVGKLRKAVDAWREAGYPGASEVTLRLFHYWFEEEHDVPGFGGQFRYHFCQREAIETLIYLVEIAGNRDAKALITDYAGIFQRDLLGKSVEFQTTTDGRRQVRRYVPELEAESIQDLPPEELRRYAFKLATGAGKTWVIAMAMVWSHFHKRRVPGSNLSTNFLLVAPNIIVYQRLEKDFGGNRIFHELPLVPPEWGAWCQKVILRGECTPADPTGNLFLTNVHQLYESAGDVWTPANAVEALLGPAPAKDLASYQRTMLERVKELKDLLVFNDEAHHVHDEDLAWSQSLLGIHASLPGGLSAWLDFSATPKDQQGRYFPWTVCDYPLAQAVEDRIVKAPIIVIKDDGKAQPKDDPEGITKGNVVKEYEPWVKAAVQRWKDHYDTYRQLGAKPVLFIMAEKNAFADALGNHLRETKEYGFKKSEVLVIHTDSAGEVTKKDLEAAREAARDIDAAKSKIKAIVSVMMLREGWDVRNVTVVLGLRPFTAKAEILPEQVIGRGLRLMPAIGPDRTQTLEVLGTPKLLDVLRQQLEADGVGVGVTRSDPPRPVTIYPLDERREFDIAIPISKPRLVHNVRKLSSLDPAALGPIYDQGELDEVYRVTLRMEFATTETEVHSTDVMAARAPFAQELLASITNQVNQRARLGATFAELYRVVRAYVTTRCFGGPIDIEQESIRNHLHRVELREGIAKYLAKQLGELLVETRVLEFERADYRLSETTAFTWRRNLPPLEAKRTIFNYVATYNDFERAFAEFLDDAGDVLRFASLGTTEQGDSGTRVRVDYLKPSGAIGFYHPDWVVVQDTPAGEVHWIIETKGRVWEGTDVKDDAARDWCARISERTNQPWRYARVNQIDFESRRPKTLAAAVRAIHDDNVLGLI
ncbi:MAG TPA: DEAD/DEAH box helicase family protein [Pirellulales bacterium]|nr:DEAD/DEAH box helicase family protein [Pirellulales bacterium]